MLAEAEKHHLLSFFTWKCDAGRAKLKNWPKLQHSPGEAACLNSSLFIDFHAQQEISCVNGGGGGRTIVRGGGGGG